MQEFISVSILGTTRLFQSIHGLVIFSLTYIDILGSTQPLLIFIHNHTVI